MAYPIGIAISVEGGSTFKKELQRCAQACKELDAEIKLTDASLGKNATTYERASAVMKSYEQKEQEISRAIDIEKSKRDGLSAQIAENHKRLSELNEETKEGEKEGRALRSENSRLQAQLKDTNIQTKSWQAELVKCQTELKTLRTQVTPANKLFGEMERSLKENSNQLKVFSSAVDSAKSRLKTAQNSVRTFGDQLGFTKTKTTILQEAQRALNNESGALKQQCLQLSTQLSAAKVQFGTFGDETVETQAKLNRAKAELAQVNLELKQNKTELALATSSWTKYNDVLNTVSTKLSNMGRGLMMTGGALTASVTTPLVAIAKDAISVAAEYEQLTNKFEILTGSANDAAKLMSEFEAYGVGSPYETAGLAKAGALLLNFGQDQKDVMDLMYMFGDMAMGNEEHLLNLARAYGQAGQQGKLMRKHLNAMVNNDFPAYQALADYLGVSTEQVQTMIDEEAISFEDLSNAMKAAVAEGGAYYGATAQFQDTLEGRMAELSDEIVRLKRLMAEPFIEPLTEGIKTLSSNLERLGVWYSGLSEEQQKFIVKCGLLAAAAGPLLLVLGALSTGFSVLLKCFTTVTDKIVSANSFTTLGKILTKILHPVSTLGGAFSKLGGLLASPLGVMAGVAAALTLIWNNSESFRSSIAQLKVVVVDVFQKAFKNAKQTLENMGLHGVGESFNSFGEVIGNVFGGIGDFLSTLTPVFITFTTIAGKVFESLLVAAGSVVSFFSSAFKIVGDVFNVIITLLSGGDVSSAFGKLSETFGVEGKKMLDSVFTFAGSLIKGLVDGIVSAVVGAAGLIMEIGGNIISGIFDGIFGYDMVSDIKSWVDNALGWFRDLFGIHSPSQVMADQVGSNLGEGVAQGLTDSENSLHSKIGAWCDKIGSWFSNAWGAIFGEKNRDSETTAIHIDMSGAINEFEAGLAEIQALAKTYFAALVAENVNTIKTLCRGLKNQLNGLVKNFDSLYSKITTDTVAEVNNLMRKVLSVYNTLKTSSLNTIKSLSTGIISTTASMASTVVSSINSMRSTVLSSINSMKTSAVSSIGSMVSSMVSSMKSLLSQFKSIGQEMLRQFRSGLDSERSKVLDSASTLVNDLIKVFIRGLEIHSPSRRMKRLGEYSMQGFLNGLSSVDIIKFSSDMVRKFESIFAGGNLNLTAMIRTLGTDGTEKLINYLNARDGKTPVDALYPLEGGTFPITSWFGYRPASDTNGIGTTNHGGLDIGAPFGTLIRAMGSGTVTYAGYNGGYGNMVQVDHGDGLHSIYAHMSSLLSSAGQRVAAGSSIGRVGSTGNSTGAHLHFEVLKNGNRVDPYDYITGAAKILEGNPLATALQKKKLLTLFKFDVGTRRVPHDMPAFIHRDEAILPASQNPYTVSGGNYLAEIVRKVLNAFVPARVSANVGGSKELSVDQIAKRVIELTGAVNNTSTNTITVNQTFEHRDPTPSEIARATRNQLRKLSVAR